MPPERTFLADWMRHQDSMLAAHSWHAIQQRRRPSVAVFLYGYFDESGKFHDRDGRICLCGFVSDGNHWNTFEREWFALLAQHGFTAIHMAQFYSQCRARGWSDTKANEVLTEFVDKIRERVQFGFGIAVDGKHFCRKFEIAGKPPQDPKRFYTHRLLRRIREELIVPGYPLHFSITFDEDEEFSIACYQIISRLRRDRPELGKLVAGIQFADDEIFTPLQAADILAHLTRQRLLTGQVPPLLQRLATAESAFSLRFDGGELWDESEIDKHWKLIESAEDMPRKKQS
jgi:hypothetical protein